MSCIQHYSSPLGTVIFASDGKALTGLWFEGQKYFAKNLAIEHEERNLKIFDDTKKWLEGKQPGGVPELSLKGSPFRMLVWKFLLKIPYGRTVTYGELASAIAEELGCSRMSAQAVGGAVGHNPVSIIVPCHRVIGADGSLTGYAGGVERKKALLSLESQGLN